MFYVHILHSTITDKYYIGFTSELPGRLATNNHPINKRWTTSYKPWELVYSEESSAKEDALAREPKLRKILE